MTLWLYLQTVDSGFAPNPMGPAMSFAVCKPLIRRKAEVGDWIVGVKSATVGYPVHTLIRSNDSLPVCDADQMRIYYAMRITDVVPMKDYDVLTRSGPWKIKIPLIQNGNSYEKTIGDSIYDFTSTPIHQRQCPHIPSEMKNDLSGENVLLSNVFYYFGGNHVRIPQNLERKVFSALGIQSVKKLGRGYRKMEDADITRDLQAWLKRSYGTGGVLGPVTHMLNIIKVRDHKVRRERRKSAAAASESKHRSARKRGSTRK